MSPVLPRPSEFKKYSFFYQLTLQDFEEGLKKEGAMKLCNSPKVLQLGYLILRRFLNPDLLILFIFKDFLTINTCLIDTTIMIKKTLTWNSQNWTIRKIFTSIYIYMEKFKWKLSLYENRENYKKVLLF